MPRSERAIFLFFAPARVWLSLCEFELSLCLLDVNATHKLFACVHELDCV